MKNHDKTQWSHPLSTWYDQDVYWFLHLRSLNFAQVPLDLVMHNLLLRSFYGATSYLGKRM